MVLRLDPAVPLVWRTPDSLQLGVATAPIRLEAVTLDDELLLGALRRGVTRTGLHAIAGARGVDAGAVDGLLAALEPVLLRTGNAAPERGEAQPPDSGVQPPGAGALVLGSGALAEGVAEALATAACRADTGRPGLAVLVAGWLVTPDESGRWLRRDVPHLPIVCSDGAVNVGPLVRPGEGACLHCVDRHRIDADPAWPAIAAQLLDLPAPTLSRLALAEALALAARTALRAVRGELAAGIEFRLDLAGGTVTERVWTRHPDCRCSTPPGTDWASGADPVDPARRDARSGTRSAQAAPALA